MRRRVRWQWLTLAIAVVLWHGCGREPPDEFRPGGVDETDGVVPSDAGDLEEGAQALSFLGETLFPPDLPPEVKEEREAQLEEALTALDSDPEGANPLIWAGRRYAYLGEYQQAIQVFTLGIDFHPDDARFYRHRGHRYITVRDLASAVADFQRAAALIEGTADEVEPDGQPNALGIPTSTLHFNIWYHYGLARYLQGDFAEAAEIYRRCMAASVHADSKVATAHWWYMSLRRLGREEGARALVRGLDLDALEDGIIESGSYLKLLRLYAGQEEANRGLLQDSVESSLEGATLGYGIGNYLLYNGDEARAKEIFRQIVADRDQWAAFGYIAAEAELARMDGGPDPRSSS